MDERSSIHLIKKFDFFSKSGGLIYHARGLKNQNNLWRPFKSSLRAELETWVQLTNQKDSLILLGPSGGYSLDADFLSGFREVWLIDIDPLAPLFFRMNFPKATLRFSQMDIFDKDNLNALTATHPNAMWLWCNLLGQLGLTRSEADTKACFRKVNSAMAGKNWFSYHDVFSYRLDSPGDFELSDHLTQGELNLLNKSIHFWRLKKNQIHLIESGYSTSELSS